MSNRISNWLRQRWRLLFVMLVPLILLPLPTIHQTPQARCGYLVLILTLYWVSAAIPLAVTSLLPLIFFPVAGILKAEEVAQSYFKDIIALFFGSFIMAYAIESVNLHRRIALFVLRLVGTSIKWSMAGLMGVTAFLSMWISNSAVTSAMLPVALAISDELERYGKEYDDKKLGIKDAIFTVNEVLELTETQLANGHPTTKARPDAFHIEEPKTEVAIEVKGAFRCPWPRRAPFKVIKPHEKKYEEIRKGFLLATAYSATIGGLSTLVGTASNVLVKGFIEDSYKDAAFRVNFLNFLLFALPVATIMLIFCWLWLQILYNRKEFFQWQTDPETREVYARLRAMFAQQYQDLGRPNWNEYCVSIVFLLMVVLWVTKDFCGTRGWGILFLDKYVTDGTVAVYCGILLSILPNSNPFKSGWKYQPIVQWNGLIKHISWDTLFLLGAGLSVASAFVNSGLSETVAEVFQFLSGVPRTVVILIIIIVSGLFTEVTSNLSTAIICFPVLDSIARISTIHPAFLVLPCTLAVSLAFMLPIGTPSNAIVFGSGTIRVMDMIKTGVVINIVGFLVILFAATTWMPKIFDLNDQSTKIFFSTNTTTFGTITTAMKARG